MGSRFGETDSDDVSEYTVSAPVSDFPRDEFTGVISQGVSE